MAKIQMQTPLVEIDGDEMTRVLWALIKEKLIAPFVDLNTEYYDLSLYKRSQTNDDITRDASLAILKYGVGVKCATISVDAARIKEYNLKKLIPSPNATIREIIDGTIFRKAITVSCIKPLVTSWKKPIIIGRHAYGDIYNNVEMQIEKPGKVEIVFSGDDGSEKRMELVRMSSPGIVQGIHNYDESIRNFARSCFNYALEEKIDVYFSTKDTISQIYDARFKTIFAEIYENEFKEQCVDAGINYVYTSIDDSAENFLHSEGGFLLACKNYDGDILSDMLGSACGSLAMMTGVLVNPSGNCLYEAAHGTVQQHFYQYKDGKKPSTNPSALIFAWSGALSRRGHLDNNKALLDFAASLSGAVIKTIEGGKMTEDLVKLSFDKSLKSINSWQFIDEVALRVQ